MTASPPKRAYLQMISELEQAADLDAYQAVKRRHASRASIRRILDPRIEQDRELDEAERRELFEHERSLPRPSEQDVLAAKETLDPERGILTLELPHGDDFTVRRIYLREEDGLWKYLGTDKYF